MHTPSINYTAIAGTSRIQVGIKCSSHCRCAEIFSEYNRNRIMSVSAAWLLVALLSEMSDGIRSASDEAWTSCCHKAWPISASAGTVRNTEHHHQRVHHARWPSHICGQRITTNNTHGALLDSRPSLITRLCSPLSLKHLSLNPPRAQSAFSGQKMTALFHLTHVLCRSAHPNGANDGHLLCYTQMRNLNSAHFHKPSQSLGLWASKCCVPSLT